MKVTTDSCLFGAIAASEIRNHSNTSILDIGTGTGLLSLIVAQQNTNAKIDAVEIDDAAAQQATENVIASPWATKIFVVNADILDFAPAQRYEVIISNPPFYEQQLLSPDANRNMAHHNGGLTLKQLFTQVNRLIKPTGKSLVMMPHYRMEEMTAMAALFNLYPEKHWLIQQTPKHPFFRSVFCFSQQPAKTHHPIEICIREEGNRYSPAFTELLKPYYLAL